MTGTGAATGGHWPVGLTKFAGNFFGLQSLYLSPTGINQKNSLIKKKNHRILKSSGAWGLALAAIGSLALAPTARANNLSREFNQRGNLTIADQFNNRVIRVSPAGMIVASYGLPLAGEPVNPYPFGNNAGYDTRTSQNRLYSPYTAKVVGDYTGLTPPFDFDGDADGR